MRPIHSKIRNNFYVTVSVTGPSFTHMLRSRQCPSTGEPGSNPVSHALNYKARRKQTIIQFGTTYVCKIN
jgi:hypothetical protein